MKHAAPAFALVITALALAGLSIATQRLVARVVDTREALARAVVLAVDLGRKLESAEPGLVPDDGHPFSRAVAEAGGRFEGDGPLILVTVDRGGSGRDRRVEIRFLRGRPAGVRFVEDNPPGSADSVDLIHGAPARPVR